MCTFPNSTPHWSKELIPQTKPSTAIRCSYIANNWIKKNKNEKVNQVEKQVHDAGCNTDKIMISADTNPFWSSKLEDQTIPKKNRVKETERQYYAVLSGWPNLVEAN